MKTVVTLLLLNAVAAFAADEWNEETGFQDWDRPARCTVSYEDGHLRMNVTGDDCSVLNSKVDLDPKEYEFIVFEYRATGDINPLPGQIYFAGEGQSLSQDRLFSFGCLRPDGEWHKAVITKLRKGRDSWLNAGRISRLRSLGIQTPSALSREMMGVLWQTMSFGVGQRTPSSSSRNA